MNEIAIVVLSMNYILVMSLPFIFFKRRDRTLRLIWWMTAAPFILLPELIVSQLTGLTPGFVGGANGALDVLSVIGIALSTASISLTRSALDTHRMPLAQWHQSQDSPTALVTSGPYARMRHPFYLAYLMMFFAAAACVPGPGTLAALVYAAILLNFTAKLEERRLCQSTFGLEYREYMARTGRFLPLLTRSPR